MAAQEHAPLRQLVAASRAAERAPEWPRVAGRQRVEHVLVDLEVQNHVHAIAAAEVLGVVARHDVRLAEQDPVAAAPLQEVAKLAEVLEVHGRRAAAARRLFEHERHGVHAKAGHAELQPVAHHLADLFLHRRVLDVEVGLEVVEAVEVPGARFAIEGPGALLHPREHHPAVGARRALRRPAVVVAKSRLWIAPRLLEPRVAVGGVVDDQVYDHAYPARPRLLRELGEIARAAKARIDTVVVRDVVAVVAVRSGLEGHQPQRCDSEAGQVVEPADEPLEVADAIAVGVHERPNVQAIEDGVLVPEILDHACRWFNLSIAGRQGRACVRLRMSLGTGSGSGSSRARPVQTPRLPASPVRMQSDAVPGPPTAARGRRGGTTASAF